MIILFVSMLLIPLLSFFISFVCLWINPRKWRLFIPFLVYFFFVGAYVFTPSLASISGFDIVVYIPLIEKYGTMSLVEAFQYEPDILYARDFLFWLFGKLHIPQMVPALTTGIIYTIAFYITCDTAERYGKYKYIGLLVLCQIAILPYVSIINNIRNVFGFSLILFAIYQDVIKSKRTWYVYLCYVFGCLMHLSAIFFIACRLLWRPAKRFFGLIAIFPFVFASLIVILYNNRALFAIGGSIGYTVDKIIWSLYGYLTNVDMDYSVQALNSITVRIDRTVMTIGMLGAIALVYYGIKSKRKPLQDNQGIMIISGMTASFTMATGVFAMPNYWRFSAAFYVLFSAVIIPFISSWKRLPIIIKTSICLFGAIAAINVFMQIWKLSWFNYSEWISSIFTSNIFMILYDFAKGVFTI